MAPHRWLSELHTCTSTDTGKVEIRALQNVERRANERQPGGCNIVHEAPTQPQVRFRKGPLNVKRRVSPNDCSQWPIGNLENRKGAVMAQTCSLRWQGACPQLLQHRWWASNTSCEHAPLTHTFWHPITLPLADTTSTLSPSHHTIKPFPPTPPCTARDERVPYAYLHTSHTIPC